MPVPKQRKSKSKRAMRRANHDKLIAPNFIACSNCGEPTMPHHLCKACGFYKGKSVVEIAEVGGDEAEAQS